jgi:hypothetical protein
VKNKEKAESTHSLGKVGNEIVPVLCLLQTCESHLGSGDVLYVSDVCLDEDVRVRAVFDKQGEGGKQIDRQMEKWQDRAVWIGIARMGSLVSCPTQHYAYAVFSNTSMRRETLELKTQYSKRENSGSTFDIRNSPSLGSRGTRTKCRFPAHQQLLKASRSRLIPTHPSNTLVDVGSGV